MLDLAELLHKWAVEEMGFRLMGQHAGSRMPDPSDLQELCRGGNAEIWNYVLRHVWSLQTVRQVKGNIMVKHAQLKQTLTFEEGKSQEDVVDDRSKLESERFLLMQELLKAESKKQHLEKSLDHLLNDMINSDRKVTTARDKVKELQHTLALRELFTASVVEKSQGFLQLRNQLDCILEALKESSRYNLQEPRDGLKSDLETTASKELQEITKAIQKFLHRLSMGDFTNDRVLLHSVKMDLWQSVRKLVKYYPKRRLLTNLIAHAQEAIISVNHLIEDVDVLKDARKLKYQQSGVITRKDVTNSYNLHQTVGQLLEVYFYVENLLSCLKLTGQASNLVF
ncbi:uncharacterized protein LOC143227371 [Tachypleus tridentatus]|uniref:uncharacterized protein LOC143227371 n=1 Tax=Tachypleus tridentatus TaxID=6853 RepID=UPI003FD1D073